MATEATNACSGGPTLIFACSGAADVGAIADQAARRLTNEGAGRMFCLAGVGGRVDQIMEQTRSASKILAIDGCPMDCVAETLRHADFDGFEHLRVTDLGFEKGKTEIDDEHVVEVTVKGKELLAD